MPVDVNMKPLADRQREIQEKIIAKDPEIARALNDLIRRDMLQWKLLPIVLGRDLWEQFWGVWRDTVEGEADKILTEIEEKKRRPKSMFGD